MTSEIQTMIQSGVLEPAPLTNWMAEVLRNQGLRLVVYLDDFLIAHQCRDTLAAHTRAALEFLTSLGWNINRKKSILVPSKSMEFLGIVWDTRFNTKFLPPDKVSKIRQYILTRLAAGSWSLKQAQRLLGFFNFATFITHRGRLHCRTLQRHARQLQKQPRRFEQFTEEVRLELEWWLKNVSQKSPIHHESLPINYVVTDASDVRWGALVNNDMLQGTWTRRQRHWHCNLKEMYAVIAAITSKAQTLNNSSIVLQSDNRTVVSFIKNEGGTSLNAVLVPHHLPGRYNTEADHLSRNRAGSEWHLLIEATEKVFNLWGTPDIDLFASSEAHVVSSYATLDLSDSNACFHDAFSKCWRFDLAWVFRPPALLPRVLHHLNSATGKYIIVAPKWTKPFWDQVPDLKSRALARPVKMKNLTTTLIDTATGRPPAQVHNLQLEAWLISAGTL
ncbi:hypothetical protein ABMA27_008431 [Loxostege sticticalis]|uniref:Reverse transcriptase domain-containing protein n=1 Tax=Loxostege sticticalis TaxID=481309 RepID=A0ABR3HBA3_LOXSC